MLKSSFHVIIVGGGLGGLCLAQGLKRVGVSVAVYERERVPGTRRQGYRLHIDARGAGGLLACLPPHLFELFTATTSRPGQQVTVFNHHLKTLKVIGSPQANISDPTRFSAAVDRLTLREILLAGLEERVHFGKECVGYEQTADHALHVHFADDTEVRGDVLVAADGVNSRIRRQFLPDATVIDTGTRCIYGKMPLTETTRPLLLEALHHGFVAIAGAPRFGMALGLVDFLHAPAEAARQYAPAIQFHAEGSYLMWSLASSHKDYGVPDETLLQMGGTALQQLASEKIKGWHPTLRALIAASTSAETFPISVKVAAPCEPWESGPVTLLGDAIHAMSPAGGSGANLALLDARLLCQALSAVACGEQSLASALHAYEAQMLRDGFAAVNFSASGGVLGAQIAPKKSLFQAIFQRRQQTE